MHNDPPRLRAIRRDDDASDDAARDDDLFGRDGTDPGMWGLRRGRRRPLGPAPRNPAGVALRVALLVAVAGAAAFATAPRLVRGDLPNDAALKGTPARGIVKADRDYALVDHTATDAQRQAAAEQSRPVWDLDLSRAQKDARALQKGLLRLAVALEPLRAAADDAGEGPRSAAAPPPRAQQASEAARAVLAGDLALEGVEAPDDATWRALVTLIWADAGFIDALTARVGDALSAPVVGDKAQLARAAATGIVVRTLAARADDKGKEAEQVVEDVATLDDAPAARAALLAKVTAELTQAPWLLDEPAARAVGRFAAAFVRPTLTTNAAESIARRERAAERVPPVIVRAHRGEVVLRPGEVITERHLLLVQAMAIQQADNLRTRAALGTGSLVALLCVVVYLFGARRVFRRSLRFKDLAFLGALLLLVLLGIVAADALAPLVASTRPGVPAIAVFFAVPVALGAMTVRLTLPPDVALLFALLAALLGGVVIEPGMEWAVVAAVSSMTGAASVTRSPRRLTLVLAGVAAGLVGAFAALTLELFRGALVGTELLWLLASTFAGGVLAGLLAVVVTPLVEALFGYTTDQKLYRLADLNQPLLKDLIVHAPGTWHHSMRTALLAEAAARAVDANPLLARVMALYHDVGKIKAPQSFSENQKGNNPHDRMLPHESAAVLRAHVDDGVKLCEEHGLPKAVTAVIREHHVDNLMEGFYNRARAQAVDQGLDHDAVDERSFRYRGQPPQTRESALVMLADQIESASRSLPDASAERLADVVDAFLQRALADDALGECDLSLRDLGRARAALTTTLFELFQRDDAGRPQPETAP